MTIPYDVGMTGVFGTAGGYQAIMDCDTLLLLGCDFAWRQFYPTKATIIQIDVNGTHLGRVIQSTSPQSGRSWTRSRH